MSVGRPPFGRSDASLVEHGVPKLLFGSGLTFVSVFSFLLISLIFRTSRARFFGKNEHFYLSASARTRPDSTETGEVGKKQG